MTVLTDTWQALVRRKLWPIALLLVAAIAAVPFLLQSDPAPVPVAPADTTASDAAVAAAVKAVEPVVAAAGDSSRRRKVLGSAKNPFEPAPLPKVKAKKQASTASKPTATTGSGSDTGGTPAGTGGDVAPAVPVATDPKPKPKRHAADSLTLRFGDANADTLTRMNLEQGEALPDEDAPVLVYLGLEKRGKVAVFLVDSSVTAQGDGSCDPDPETCETLRLRVGDTEFLDISNEDGSEGASYELDLLKTWPRSKASTSKAGASAKASTAGLGDVASTGPDALGLAGIARLLGSL